MLTQIYQLTEIYIKNNALTRADFAPSAARARAGRILCRAARVAPFSDPMEAEKGHALLFLRVFYANRRARRVKTPWRSLTPA
jgi:hypothetical protein